MSRVTWTAEDLKKHENRQKPSEPILKSFKGTKAKSGKVGHPSLQNEDISQMYAQKQSKFKNKKVVDGIMAFDSQKEHRRWLVLCDMQNKGEILELKRQEKFSIDINRRHICNYFADFTYYTPERKYIVEDVKSDFSRKKPSYRLKLKLLRAVLDIEILET